MRLKITSATLLAAAVCLFPSAASAHAQGAWWNLQAGTRPAHLTPGVAQNEVQQLSTTTTEFEGIENQAAFAVRVGEVEELFATEPTASAIGFRPLTEANLQSTLEAAYGPGNVKVTEETPSEGTLRFDIESTGEKADLTPNFQELVQVEAFGVGEPEAKVLTKGQPDGQIFALVTNVGDASLTGQTTPVKILDRLPAGLRAVGIVATHPGAKGDFHTRRTLPCNLESSGTIGTCTVPTTVAPYEQVEMRIAVVFDGPVSTANKLAVTGGESFLCQKPQAGGIYGDLGCTLEEATGRYERTPIGPVAPASLDRALAISATPAAFGVESYELNNEQEGGAPATQAGEHQFQQTTSITLNQKADLGSLENMSHQPHPNPVALPKDLYFRWPSGLIGNPSVVAQCSDQQFFSIVENSAATLCPANSAVGVAVVTINEPHALGTVSIPVPLFNLKPHPGEPARFGFNVTIGNTPVVIDTAVRTGSDYGVTVKVTNITQSAALISSQVTVWGVPGDPRHDHQRGWSCLLESSDFAVQSISEGGIGACQESPAPHPVPFLSQPTSCTGPLSSTVEGDSWSEPANLQKLSEDPMPALDGCNRLPFNPSINVTPDVREASKPSGLTVDVHVPQEESLNAGGLAEADPRNITVALPEGVAVNPSSGDGLAACSEPLAGFTGFSELFPPGRTATFTETLPSPLQQAVNFCPDASKIATVTIKTPILPHPIEGAVYLAAQNANPFGGLVAMYVIAEDPVSGVLIKLAGNVHLTETGQIVTTFEDSPQAPFEDAEFHFFGGERAPLATPARCGPYETKANMTSWAGTPAVNTQSTFEITSGPNGGPCPGATLPFTPTLNAGTVNINAGSFTPLTTTIGRADGQQNLSSVVLHMPAGVEGLLTGVKLCDETNANAGTCGPESLIGETTVSAGVGQDPVTVVGGKVYLTEKYAGAPFGLSIVNPVKAGPFDLEHDTSNPNQNPPCDCVVVRAKIDVDPHTAALTVTTDPSGPHAIPSVIDGIPVQIQKVNVNVNREHFTFNPTSCDPATLTGAITGQEGATQPLSVPFQATNCAALKFTPKFSVSTGAHTSKANGASLTAKLSEPNEPQGSQANIAKVKVELPKQLPSRLTTLQKACTNAQFEANPAGCPAASNIGHAKVTTPLLPVPLEGPAIFVSHGGEAFPSLTMVLQGYGVKVDLVGTTFISKAGVTSTTFKTVPDVPFNTFELTLPTGPYSALTALGSVCNESLTMPAEFIAQNGMTFNQNTRVGVNGCPRKKALTRAQKLAKALKACRRHTKKGPRVACERAARKRYAPAKGAAKRAKHTKR